MSRTKIAPTLREWIEMDRAALRQADPGWRQVNAELRGLFAALREAERTHNHAYFDVDEEERCGFCHALARLRRVSGGARTTKGGGR